MCFALDSQLFWIISGLLVAVSLLCLFTLRQFIRQLRSARSPGGLAQVVLDHFPALTVNGIWLFIVVSVAGACVY